MTEPDVDSELERLLSQTRAETEPAPAARARIRAALESRLASAPSPSGRMTRLALVGGGAAIAALVWLSPSRPRTPAPRLIETSAPVVSAPAAALVAQPVMEPQPSVAVSSLAPAKIPPRVVGSATEPGAELALIAAMQAALRAGNSAQALSLAEQHAQRFSRGELVQEREGVRAVARCRLASPSGRAALGAAFLGRYPGSPYAARVRDACR